jgi:Dehydrogenases with different specificities (related to short-chain alcohol dehydrogenases)
MNGKTVVMTGGTSGIGEVAAFSLAAMGARIVFVARDKARAEARLAKLQAAGPAAHRYHLADLFLLAEQKRVAAEIAAGEPQIDVLINNAGAFFESRGETAEGLERSFALNHMAYFTITAGLLERLQQTAGARIVSTSSDAHRLGRIDFDDLQSQKTYRGFSVYGTTKLMNILFTRELARRLNGSGVEAFCLHPGFVATRFADNNGGLMGTVFALLKRLAAISPQQGARTIIHLASSPEVVGKSGTYWYKCQIAKPRGPAQSDLDAGRLWDLSEAIAHG